MAGGNGGSIFVRLGLKDDATKQMRSTLSGMKSSMLKFAGTMGALGLAKEGIKQASDFAENWSIVMAGVGKDTQDTFMDTFKELKRTSKAQFSDIAATYVGTLKAKGVSEDTIKALGPDLFKRLEDVTANFNGTAEQTMDAFTSMMSGQAKSMEKLTKGAVIPLVANLDALAQSTDGVNFDDLAPDEQALTRLNFFMQESAKVPGLVGNSNRTIGTFKGQMDAMKKSVKDSAATIMSSLMPAISKVIGVLAKLAEWIGKNKALIGALAGAFAGFKIASFLIKMGKVVMAMYAAAVAKAGAAGGIMALVTAGAVATGLAAILGGIGGGMFFSGGGSTGGGATSTGTAQNTVLEVQVTASNGATAVVSGNGFNTKSQGSLGASVGGNQ